MRTMSIIGTRPELIRMSEVIKKLDRYTDHTFIHTGQNYDYELDEIFYKDLGLRKPDDNLKMTAIGNILNEIGFVMDKVKPDAVVILGDTNSSLAGYVAKRKKIPLFHLEAGNRCFDDNVPEEINRKIIDHIADVNICYTESARRNLEREGLAPDRTFVVGSPIKEIVVKNIENIKKRTVMNDMELERDNYYLVSVHREENVENKTNLDTLVKVINKLSMSHNVVLSCHPRLRNKNIKFHKNVQVCKPFGFLDYQRLQVGAKCVISDSGTISEESAILGFPAITVRNAMERPEAIDAGSMLMTGIDYDNILKCLEVIKDIPRAVPPIEYHVDNFSDKVLKIILGYTGYVNRNVWHDKR